MNETTEQPQQAEQQPAPTAETAVTAGPPTGTPEATSAVQPARIRPADIPRLVWGVIDRFYIDPLRKTLIDLEGLSWPMRLLTYFGYAAVLVLLVATLVLEGGGEGQPQASFSTTRGVREVALPVMVASSVGLALGWAYILSSATGSRLVFFFPVMAVFGVDMLSIAPQEGSGMGFWLLFAIPLFLATLIGYPLSRKKPFWTEKPGRKFVLWLVVMGILIALLWTSDADSVAGSLNGSSSLAILISVPYWAISGLAIVDAVVGAARNIVTFLRRLFPDVVLRALATFLVLAHPVLSLVFIALQVGGVNMGTGILIDGALSIPLLIAMLITALRRRWNVKNAMTFLALAIILPVFALGVAFSWGGTDISDLVGVTMEQTGLLPPLVVFVVVTAYTVLSAGSTLANRDGVVIPRTPRVMLTFGVALLVISFTIFFVNTHIPSTGRLDESMQDLLNNIFSLSVVFLGTPYLAWALWRRRDRLTGDESKLAGVQPVLAGLQRIDERRWLVAGLAAAGFFILVLCVLGMIFTPGS